MLQSERCREMREVMSNLCSEGMNDACARGRIGTRSINELY